jgi:hypothetical protein
MRLLIVLALLASCSSGDGTDAVFPADYAATYQQVRNCRRSLEHDLMTIRVRAAPDALTPYTDRATPFPTGAVVLKEQYGGDDTTCSKPIEFFTVMVKLAPGSSPATLDWQWQKVDADRNVVSESVTGCVRCHEACVPPDGYDSTCTVP